MPTVRLVCPYNDEVTLCETCGAWHAHRVEAVPQRGRRAQCERHGVDLTPESIVERIRMVAA
jgi:hypothetical protein